MGYSGFTGRLVGTGGLIDTRNISVLEEISALVRLPDIGNFEDAGGGGLLLRATYHFHGDWHPSVSDRLSAYIVAFGRKEENTKFSLHKVEEGRVDTWIGPSQPTPQGSVDVSGFSSDKWYHIKAEAQGDNLRAKFWEKGTVEPGSWNIDYTDAEPLGGGFFGVIHTDAHEGNSVQWDSFAVGPQPQDSAVFLECGGIRVIPVLTE